MCLIIASQTGKVPSQEIVQNAYSDNRDGWGIARYDCGRIIVEKGTRLNSALAVMERAEGQPYVMHFRWATHGAKDRTNTHPFRVYRDIWMAHNGIIPVTIMDETKSDTYHFAAWLGEMLALDSTWYDTPEFVAEVETFIGESNKLAFIRADGCIKLLHESRGTHAGGIWYSNDHSFPGQRYFTASSKLCKFDSATEAEVEFEADFAWDNTVRRHTADEPEELDIVSGAWKHSYAARREHA